MKDGNKAEILIDRVDPDRAAALLATLSDDRHVGVGTILPPFAHLAFFWDPVPENGLGSDGHPKLGSGLPDLGLPIRMWAGGTLRWHSGFRAGVQAEKISRVTSVTHKDGRTGKLGFVIVRHEIRQRGAPVVTEDQSLVYREVGGAASDPPVANSEADERQALNLSSVTLFRYSALTFNAHRIHYDADYARENGYEGIVVHGPLIATQLALMAEKSLGPLKHFSFKARSPLILGDVAWLCRAGTQFWVEGPRRRLVMTAEAQ